MTIHPRVETGSIPGIAEDGTLFPIEKMDAHRQGVLHLAISIFVFDENRILLQRRATDKYHSGGLWANTCCSHPHFGETQEQCAQRRLVEELGFTVPLARCSTVDYQARVSEDLWEHERVAVFEGQTSASNVDIKPTPSEVAEVRWVPLEEFFDDIAENPNAYTQWLQIYAHRWAQLGISVGVPSIT